MNPDTPRPKTPMVRRLHGYETIATYHERDGTEEAARRAARAELEALRARERRSLLVAILPLLVAGAGLWALLGFVIVKLWGIYGGSFR